MANQIRVYLYYCPFPTCNFRGESRGQYMSHLASHSEENLEDVRQDHRESTLKAIHEGAQQRGLQPRDPAMIDVIKEVTVTPVMERSILKTAPVVQHQTERFTGNVNRNVFQAPQMYDHDYTLSRNTKVPPSLISHVSQAAEHLYSTEKLLLQTLTAEQNKTILEIFGQLHGFMPYEDLYDVFFMFSVRVGDQLFYHFIEGGKTFGFLHNSQSMPTPTAYYRQHTQEELKNAKELKDFQHARKLCLIDKRVKKLADIDKSVVPGMFMYILKKKKSRKGNDDRYHYQFGFDAEEDGIMKELSGHIESGCKPYPTTYPPTEQLSLQQQYNVLSSLPNDHTASFITRRNTVSYEKDRKKRMECNRAFQDCRPILKDGETVGTRQPIFKPYSFRNRLIHYLKHYDASYISVMLKYHYDGVVPSIVDGRSSVHVEGTSSTNDVLPTVSEESVAPPVDPLAVGVEPMVVDVPVVVVSQPHTSEPSGRSTSSASFSNMSLPCTYNEVFRAGLAESRNAIKWRYHSEDRDILTMHEYDIKSGRILLNTWCHIHCQRLTDRIVCQCTCKAYCTNFTTDTNSDMYTNPCLHVRYYKEHIKEHVLDLFQNVPNTNESFLFQKLKLASQYVGCAVTALSPEASTVKKFSVLCIDNHDHSIVELNSENFLVCQAAVCQIGKCHKRKVSSLDHGKICPHLELMRTNVELWEQFVFPPDMKSSSVEKSFFDVHTQKWDFGGFRKHQPVDEDDPKLLKLRRERLLCAAIAAPLEPGAPNQLKFIEGKDLVPDNPGLCNCASPVLYVKEYEFITNIYYLLYPAKHRVFKLVCSNRRCEILYTGENECIHFHTRETGCAAEMGYEFMSYLLESHGNFTKFCSIMDRQYKLYFKDKAFLSVTTFTAWFYGWAAQLDIDFRKSADPFCGTDPKQLACDGTHIGITGKMLHVVPIDKPETDEIVMPQHTRNSRIFMPLVDNVNKDNIRKARDHLLKLSKFFIDMSGERLTPEEQHIVLTNLPSDDMSNNFLTPFIQDNLPIGLRQSAAHFIKLFLKQSPVSSVLPYGKINKIKNVLEGCQDNPTLINSLSDVGPELILMLQEAKHTEFFRHSVDFVMYLCNFVVQVHQYDPPSAPAVPLPNTYNPEEGRAYYFAGHGQQVRKLPRYGKAAGATSKELCRKDFPRVSKHGWSHLFLWFCAKHEHCYGYHIISGSEGRKDPFASAYQYMENAPDHIWYDFSCSLCEYALNREPHFFRETRFWLDEFHSYHHTCGDNHKSQRVADVPHPNTSVCEQFNSYLKNFLYFQTHQTQSHFTFFLQFFIHVWNKRKTKLCLENQRHSAAALE